VIESHFGESSPGSIGIEEELMILDAATLEPVGAVDVLIRGAEGLALPGRLKTEFHASVVELNTDVCADVAEAIAALRELRAAAYAIARENGLVVAAAGAHPTVLLETLPIAPKERYLSIARRIGRAMRRQGVNGMHVHVGIENGERCYERLEAVLPWLPVVLALSANSPFIEGSNTGMLSTRASILAELPRAGAPPPFGSYAEWETWVERLVAFGVLEEYTRIWWDVRPHPQFGTLELRIADQPTSLERTALLAELLASLVARAPAREPRPASRGEYAQNRWAAARFGLDAQLIHPDGDRVASARELAREWLGFEPPEPEALSQLAAADPLADLVARSLR
jgi:glutamate---cysteine ligase / carboxylate-amine ligase